MSSMRDAVVCPARRRTSRCCQDLRTAREHAKTSHGMTGSGVSHKRSLDETSKHAFMPLNGCAVTGNNINSTPGNDATWSRCAPPMLAAATDMIPIDAPVVNMQTIMTALTTRGSALYMAHSRHTMIVCMTANCRPPAGNSAVFYCSGHQDNSYLWWGRQL